MKDSAAAAPWMTWRALDPRDSAALHELDAACKQVDGVEPVSDLPGDALAACRDNPDNTFCAETRGKLAAVGWVVARPAVAGTQTILLGGRVHPDYRRKGFGTALLSWSHDRALGVAAPDATVRLVIKNEALTADAHTIYLEAGFEPLFAEHMLVRSFEDPLPEVELPSHIHTADWQADTAPLFFRAYQLSFADRPGFPDPDGEDWIGEYEREESFRPDLSRVALAGDEPVGFVTCDIFGGFAWITQAGVVPAYRGQGIAFALLVEALKRFQAEGLPEAALHVNANNPRAARRFHDVGFRRRLTRARYEKQL